MDSALIGALMKGGSQALGSFATGMQAERRRKLLEDQQKALQAQKDADYQRKLQDEDTTWLKRFKITQEVADDRAARAERKTTDRAMTKAYVDVETDRIKASKTKPTKVTVDDRFDQYLQGKYQPKTDLEKQYFEGLMQKGAPKPTKPTKDPNELSTSDLFKAWVQSGGKLPGGIEELGFQDYASQMQQQIAGVNQQQDRVAGGAGTYDPTGFDPSAGGILPTGNAGIDAFNQFRMANGGMQAARGADQPAAADPQGIDIGQVVDPENSLSPDEETALELLTRANAGEQLSEEEQQFLDEILSGLGR
jgi:hypothetical protein